MDRHKNDNLYIIADFSALVNKIFCLFWQNIWLGWQDSNLRMTESKSVALPLGYTPLSGTAKSRRETPPKRLAVVKRLCPARIRRLKLGWMEGIEPSGAGATIRCVNRFATSTTHNKYGTKTSDACQEHF